jgi:hypothetical protein
MAKTAAIAPDGVSVRLPRVMKKDLPRRVRKKPSARIQKAILSKSRRAFPEPTIREDVKDTVLAIKDKLQDLERAKKKAISGSATKTASIAKMLPETLRNPASLGVIGASAALFGLANYIASRPKKSLGGKSVAQTELEKQLKRQQAVAGKDDKLRTRISRRTTEYQKNLADEYAKSPRAAALRSAGIGAGVGSLAGLGLLKLLT